MSFPPRRVVTVHDERGRGVVAIDETIHTQRSLRRGHDSCVLWTTDPSSADPEHETEDAADRPVGRSIAGGTVFRITRYAPGVASAPHMTDSVDYAVVLSGSIDLVLDSGSIALSQGDVLVQRGTRHDWVNNGTEDCVIAFCLVGAEASS